MVGLPLVSLLGCRITRVLSDHFCDTSWNLRLEKSGRLVFGVRPFLLYHRSGCHFDHGPEVNQTLPPLARPPHSPENSIWTLRSKEKEGF